jgi:NTE family protein
MPDVALALGGGGIKGLAHVGVIRKLEEEGYTVRAIAGTSAGGMVGAVYAAGYAQEQIEHILTKMSQMRSFTRAAGEGPSLLGMSAMAQMLIDVLGSRRFEELKLPFACTAVDLKTAQEVILSQGRVVDAVLATMAVPGVFPPREMGDALLIDGGVMDPVPVALARWLAPTLPVIAVALSPVPAGWRHMPVSARTLLPSKPPIPLPFLEQITHLRIAQAMDIFTRSIDITSLMMTELRLQIDQPDAIIRPEVWQYGMLEAVDPHELIWMGEKATSETLKVIEETNAWHKRFSRMFRKAEPPGMLFSDGIKPPEAK